MVQMLHGAQIAEAHKCVTSEKLRKHAEDADEFISRTSNELGLGVKYIYGQSGEPGLRRDRSRKWSDWEI